MWFRFFERTMQAGQNVSVTVAVRAQEFVLARHAAWNC